MKITVRYSLDEAGQRAAALAGVSATQEQRFTGEAEPALALATPGVTVAEDGTAVAEISPPLAGPLASVEEALAALRCVAEQAEAEQAKHAEQQRLREAKHAEQQRLREVARAAEYEATVAAVLACPEECWEQKASDAVFADPRVALRYEAYQERCRRAEELSQAFNAEAREAVIAALCAGDELLTARQAAGTVPSEEWDRRIEAHLWGERARYEKLADYDLTCGCDPRIAGVRYDVQDVTEYPEEVWTALQEIRAAYPDGRVTVRKHTATCLAVYCKEPVDRYGLRVTVRRYGNAWTREFAI